MVKRTRKVKAQTAVVAYLRASRDEQKNGPEAQRAAIEAWAAREGVQVASWHVDQGVSGGAALEDCPALLEAMAAVPKGGAMVVSSRDRMARDNFRAAVIESKVRVVSADGVGNEQSPESVMMKRMIDAIAEYERARIKARTVAALGAKKRRGELTGTAPYGMKVDEDGVHLVADEVEGRVVARAKELSDQGLTVRAIAAALNAEGYRNRAGKEFAFQSVYVWLAAA
jgi:DNA invertase Pin-like site-specific DNA recombinase